MDRLQLHVYTTHDSQHVIYRDSVVLGGLGLLRSRHDITEISLVRTDDKRVMIQAVADFNTTLVIIVRFAVQLSTGLFRFTFLCYLHLCSVCGGLQINRLR